jgi:basic membrane protein A
MTRRLLNLIVVMALMFTLVSSAALAAPAPQAAEGQSYVIQTADWLSKLADKYLGSVSAWPAIMLATNKKAETDSSFHRIQDPDLIEPGWKVWVPGAEEAKTLLAEFTLKKVKVGLVTDVGGVNDKSFNQSAWGGVQQAMKAFGLEGKFIESKQPTDYEKNIDQFATEKYDVIITVGFLMGDGTAAKAKQYPDIKFAIVDFSWFPGTGPCPQDAKDCYVKDYGLDHVTSLMFQEDEVGCLAGVLAAGMSKTGTICSVAGMEIPPVVRFVTGYQTCAKWMKADTKALNVYIPSFTDPAKGKEVGESMIAQGCDVVFGVGGNTGNGGLLAAKEKGLMAIGVDVDQYNTYPEVKDALLSSAAKNVDTAVYNYLKSVVYGTEKAGISLANLKNRGIGLAPYHDWENKIPQAVKDKVKEAEDGLISGTLSTGYKP